MLTSLRTDPQLPLNPGFRPLPRQPAPYGLAAGIRLDLARGSARVDELMPGDMLQTTAGPQPVLRVLKQTAGLMLEDRQVALPAGLLGFARPMVVAEGQKIVVSSIWAQLHLEADAVEITAAALVEAGLARYLAPVERETLFLPVVLRASAAHAGLVSVALNSVEDLTEPMAQGPLRPERPALSGDDLRVIDGLPGRILPR